MLTLDVPRLQPHDPEAERAVMGAVFYDPASLCTAQEVLSPEDFYDNRHRCIFDAMVALATRSEVVDPITVGNELDCRQQLESVGGRAALAELTMVVGSAANIRQYATIERDCAKRRHIIRLTAELSQRAYAKVPADDILEQAQRDFFHIASGREAKTWRPLRETCKETIAFVDEMSNRKQAVVEIPTGFRSLDSLLGGWHRSDLIIVAGRPSMGKTSFALGSALAAARSGYTVGIISIEMSWKQLGLRLVSMGAPINVHALRSGRLSREEWSLFAGTAHHLEPLPFWIDDSAGITIEQVASKARHLKARHGLDVLVLDYLQLLHISGAESRQLGVADASRRLKLLAKDLDIPVIALSQLSRDCEKRPSAEQRPKLSDLRDSGAIEQDADVVLFIYREDAAGSMTGEKGLTEILIRKHRNGPIGDRVLTFEEQFARFTDL